eukprot:SAG25_NODE_12399_length_280_cov_1.419890_2_plen_25_part_01
MPIVPDTDFGSFRGPLLSLKNQQTS